MELIRAKGGKITREPGPVKGGRSVIAFIEDPDGYKFELIERGPTPEPLCQVMLRVGDLNRSIEFYEKVRVNAILCWFRLLFSCFLYFTLRHLCYCFPFRHLVWSCFVHETIQNTRYDDFPFNVIFSVK